eukprot:751542-Hanusia_phi.AAC.1
MDPKSVKCLVKELLEQKLLPIKNQITELEAKIDSIRDEVRSSSHSELKKRKQSDMDAPGPSNESIASDHALTSMDKNDQNHCDEECTKASYLEGCNQNVKGLLIMLCTKYSLDPPTFSTTKDGVDHEPTFSCKVTIGSRCFSCSEQPTKRSAEREASKIAIERLFEFSSGTTNVRASSPDVSRRSLASSSSGMFQEARNKANGIDKYTNLLTNGWRLQVLVDADNSANILPLLSSWLLSNPIEVRKQITVDVFCGRHFSGPKSDGFTFHFASSGLREAADHEISFFAGQRVNQWKSTMTLVLVISKDDAIENTVEMLKRDGIHSSFESPTQIASRDSIQLLLRKLAERVL